MRVQVSIGTDPYEVFSGADWALMVGAKPRGPGMERADLLNQNGEIFQVRVCGARTSTLLALCARTGGGGVDIHVGLCM